MVLPWLSDRDTPAVWLPRRRERGAVLGGELVGADALQFAGHFAGILADVGVRQGAIDDDVLGAFTGAICWAQAGESNRLAAANRPRRAFMLSPFCGALARIGNLSQIAEFAVRNPALTGRKFTKDFLDDLMLTPRTFGRRVFLAK